MTYETSSLYEADCQSPGGLGVIEIIKGEAD